MPELKLLVILSKPWIFLLQSQICEKYYALQIVHFFFNGGL